MADEDAGPTKAWIVTNRKDPEVKPFFDHAYGKRPREELYDVIGYHEAEPALDALFEEHFERGLEMNPIRATFIGDNRYNDRLANTNSPEYRAAAKAMTAFAADAAMTHSTAVPVRMVLMLQLFSWKLSWI